MHQVQRPFVSWLHPCRQHHAEWAAPINHRRAAVGGDDKTQLRTIAGLAREGLHIGLGHLVGLAVDAAAVSSMGPAKPQMSSCWCMQDALRLRRRCLPAASCVACRHSPRLAPQPTSGTWWSRGRRRGCHLGRQRMTRSRQCWRRCQPRRPGNRCSLQDGRGGYLGVSASGWGQGCSCPACVAILERLLNCQKRAGVLGAAADCHAP